MASNAEGASPYKHPYHLVEPSYWPILSAFSAGIMLFGIIVLAHGGGQWVLGVGAVAVVVVDWGVGAGAVVTAQPL